MALGNAIASLASKENEDPLEYLRNLIRVLLDNMMYEYPPLVAKSARLYLTLLNVPFALQVPLQNIQILSQMSGVAFLDQAAPVKKALQTFSETTISVNSFKKIIEHFNFLTQSILVDPTNTDSVKVIGDYCDILRNMDMPVIVGKILESFSVQQGLQDTAVLPAATAAVLQSAYRLLSLLVAGLATPRSKYFPTQNCLSATSSSTSARTKFYSSCLRRI